METINNATKQMKVLADFLNCAVDELSEGYEYYGLDSCKTIECGNQEYLCVNKAQSDAAVKAYIEETLWAFNASFIFNFLDIDFSDRTLEAWKKMAGNLCEDLNEVVKAMIGKKMNAFVKEAVKVDGKGHFLSGYDGKENEHKGYFIYRIN